MKHIVISLLYITFSLHCCEHSNLTIRPAQLGDIEQLNKLSTKQYQNDLKPLWKQYYARFFPHINSETFIAEKTKLNNETNEKIIRNEDPSELRRLIVAEIKDEKTDLKKVAGFCRFEPKNEQTIYMHFILIDEDFRKKGIAKQLAAAAIQTFPHATLCTFRAHVYNKTLNEIYTTCGCKQVGQVSIDLTTGGINTNPNAPITHFDYEYMIKKS